MKKRTLVIAILATLGTSSHATAGMSIEERLEKMEQRIQQLENKVQNQDEIIQAKQQQISELTSSVAESNRSGVGKWWQSVEIGGAIEVEATHASTDGSDDTSDITASKAEIGLTAQVNDWVSGEIVIKWGESDSSNTIELDTALISIADPDASWFANAGRYTLPFGNYNTNMLSDPLTGDIGEIGVTALEAGYSANGASISAFTFQSSPSNDIDSFGAVLGYEGSTEQGNFSAHLGYVNNLAESGGWVTDGNQVPGWIASAQLDIASFTIIGEYLAATDDFNDAGGTQPSAYNIEIGYSFDAGTLPAVVALGYQGTDDANHANWDIAENRVLGALSIEIMDGTSIGLEYMNEESYAGEDSDTVTGKLSVEF